MFATLAKDGRRDAKPRPRETWYTPQANKLENDNDGLADVEPPKRVYKHNYDQDANNNPEKSAPNTANRNDLEQPTPVHIVANGDCEVTNAHGVDEGSDDDSNVYYTDPDGDNTTPDIQDSAPATTEGGTDNGPAPSPT